MNSDPARLQARLAIVEEHVECENRHDLAGLMATFGGDARYDDEPWRDHRLGPDAVRAYYSELLTSMPDLAIDIRKRHVAADAIVLEVTISGTHTGSWHGLLATGRHFKIPLCGVYTFDDHDRLAGERIYYDRATVFAQLGIFHEPVGLLGKIALVLNHPLTVGRSLVRAIWK